MPTFLALQCYKCNMMQVKHDKKSTNKWSCSVCNEKQSVRKVYATSMAAKDIRKFVQDYNFSRNSARDHALAELMLKVEKGDVAPLMCDDAPSHHSLLISGDCIHPQVNADSKWTEYLPPQDDEIQARMLEDDVKFVTTIPETFARNPKGRVRAAAEEQDEQYPILQKQGLSLTKRLSAKLSNKPMKNLTVCVDAIQKENDLPSVWTGKASSVSSLQAQKAASVHHRRPLYAYKVAQSTVCVDSIQKENDLPFIWTGNDSPESSLPAHKAASVHHRQPLSAYKAAQTTVAGVLKQRSAASHLSGERVWMQASFERNTSVASNMLGVSTDVNQKPVSKWAAFLDSEKDVKNLKACATAEEEIHVSKWAKYMDSDEVMQRKEAMQGCGSATKWGEFLDAGGDPFSEPRGSQGMSSVWSLKAASNLQYLNGLVKTELEELVETACISEEVDEEVHPLFL